MKKLFKIFPSFMVLVALCLFQNIFGIFLNKQLLLLMESNYLLTNHHIKCSNYYLNENIENEMANNSYWKYTVIDDSNDTTILAYYSNNYAKSILPLSNGKMFEMENSKQAIVGKKISTVELNGTEWISYRKDYYEVVGKIGLTEDSPVDNYILINETDLFQEAYQEETYFDSLDTKKMDVLKEKYNLKRNNIGIERWLNISSYTSILYLMGIILMFSVSVIIAFIFLNSRKDLNELKHELGISLSKSIKKEIATLFCIDVGVLLAIVLYHNQSQSNRVIAQIITYNLFCIIVMVTIYVINVSQQLRGVNK